MQVHPIESSTKSSLAGSQDPLEQLLRRYINEFIDSNRAAKVVANGLRVLGVGFRPVIDHMTFRAHDVDERCQEFTRLGYKPDVKIGLVKYKDWWAKVFRKPGYPTLFIDQAFEGKKGKTSSIPAWVNKFGDKVLHHVAIQVDDIETAVFYLEKQGIPFAAKIIGGKNTDLRQVFAEPEMKFGMVYSVLELIERHRGVTGFLPPESGGLA